MKILPALLLISAFATVSVASAQTPSAAPVEPPDIPNLEVKTLDGSSFDLAAQRGKWVVVNYWATWCSPCLKEMPDLDAFAASREDVVVVGLAYEDIEEEEMREFLADHPVSYPIAIVDVFDPPTAFPAPRGLPMTWLISPQGQVARRFLGPVTSRDLEQAIAGMDAQ